jgi:hypothetical protein
MTKFNWYARPITSQLLKIQINNDIDFDKIFDDAFLKYTTNSELISIDSVHSGLLTELVYSVNMDSKIKKQDFINALKVIN